MAEPAALPFAAHRTVAEALTAAHRARNGRLLWWMVPRRSAPGWAADTRKAYELTIDGSRWRLEPAGNHYSQRWIVYRDGIEIASTRQLAVAKQTVARTVGAKGDR